VRIRIFLFRLRPGPASGCRGPLGANNLADMYLRGDGAPQITQRPSAYFKKPQPRGHAGARIKLAYMYADGLGTPKDPEAARHVDNFGLSCGRSTRTKPNSFPGSCAHTGTDFSCSPKSPQPAIRNVTTAVG
jgi:hypothetical protein